MTENTIYFVVESPQKPVESNAIYDIHELGNTYDYHEKYELITRLVGQHWVDSKHNWRYYIARSYFQQPQAFQEIANQYKDHLLFFGFTAADCDFSKKDETEHFLEANR